MKTHRLEHIHNRREKKIFSGYLQPNTSNNSIKTHCLKAHRHERQIERRYVVVTHSLINQLFNENSPSIKHRHDRRREKRLCGGYPQPNTSNYPTKTHHVKCKA